ncbi:uncharacterized protein LOC124154356 [Ischnura elegans]|uniref:uncharacterized protein LOC124154356 n=1 Tax=Ischnura elegans TaxID=197161 RepID=UPI001ED86EE2|nr:uncharacterized protein LOC124154356 [Ischnura elegans]
MGSVSFILPCILGAFFFVALCYATPAPSPDLEFERCRNSSEIDVEVLMYCVHSEFQEDKLLETYRMYNTTRCVHCRNFCRKQETFLNCFRTFTGNVKDLSNKSRLMVPFFGRLFEEVIIKFCENESLMSAGYSHGEDGRCYKESRKSCGSHISPFNNMEDLAFCDKENTEYGEDNRKFTCQTLLEYLKCTETAADSCSDAVKNTHATTTSLLLNSETCGEYLA